MSDIYFSPWDDAYFLSREVIDDVLFIACLQNKDEVYKMMKNLKANEKQIDEMFELMNSKEVE